MKHKTKKNFSNTNNNKTKKNCDSLNKTIFYHSFEDSVSKEIEKRALINKKKHINYKDILIKSFANASFKEYVILGSGFFTFSFGLSCGSPS